MAKKELRRAVREGQAAKDKKQEGPTIRGAVIKGLLLSGIWLVLMRLFAKDTSIWLNLLFAVVFFVLYTVFIFYWDRWLFRRRKRRQLLGGK
jgi:hypothetical protein